MLAAAIAALICVGCAGTTSSPILGNAHNPRIRVVNGTTTPSNVSIDSQIIATNLAFGASTAYTIETNSDHTIFWKDASTNGTMTSTSELFQLNHFYTVVDAGTTGNFKTIILDDDRATDANTAKVRVANVASSAGAVDVYITAPGADISGSQPTLANLTYPSNSDYQGLVPGTYEIRFTQTGTKTIVFDQQVTLSAATNQTIILLSNTGGATTITVNDLSP